MLKKLWRLILKLFNFKDKEEGVPQGVQVFDENGVIQLDTTTRASIFIDEVTLKPSVKQVTINNDLISSNTPFYLVLKPVSDNDPLSGISTVKNGNSYTVKAEIVRVDEVKIMIGVY